MFACHLGNSGTFCYGIMDMLDTLDDVCWSKLRHAYGAADDVPGLIRALNSASKKERGDAIFQLYGNIWHQGTVYEATAHAVPFLLELVSSQQTPDRHEILSLLGSIAEGSSFIAVHKNLPHRKGMYDEASERTELEWVADARSAVRSGWNIVKSCFSAQDHQTCAAAAYVLSRYSEASAEVVKLLSGRFAAATKDHLLRTGLMMLAKDLIRPGDGIDEWIEAAVWSDSCLPVRVAAAVAMTHGHGATVPDRIVEFLVLHMTSNEEIDQAYLQQPWDKPGALHEIIEALCLSPLGRRLSIISFNAMLEEPDDQLRLLYCRTALHDALSPAPGLVHSFRRSLCPISLPEE